MLTFERIEHAPEPAHRIEPRVHIPSDHPVLSPDARALWDGNEAWVWLVPEMDGETFYVYLDAEGPQPGWLDYIDETEGLHFAMFPEETGGDEMAKALMEMGVAPDQAFFVHMTFEYNWGDGWETDDEMILEWDILDREPLDPAEAAARWEAWLTEWRG